MKSTKGSIFNIQRYSVQDGPGIRSTVFMKGCPLRCFWCHNPEGQLMYPEVLHRNSLCNNCRRCVEVCESHSISLIDGGVRIDRHSCTNCGKCVEVCSPRALALVGQYMSVEAVLEELKRDALFYRNSNGGITISGGEPLTQADFVSNLLEACHENGLNTTLDTSGYASARKLETVLRHVDLVLYDLKDMNRVKHRDTTGVYNDVILRNAKTIAHLGIPMIIRIAVIPTVNDSAENLEATATFITKLEGVEKVQLLPYHRAAAGKYHNLDRACPLEGIGALHDQDLLWAKEIMESYGLETEIGG